MLRSSNTPGTRSDRLWPNARPKRPSTPRRIRRNSKRSKVRAENLDAMEFRIFATCLSELRDDVPQWRSYASDGRGVCPRIRLREHSNAQGFPIFITLRQATSPLCEQQFQEQIHRWTSRGVLSWARLGYGDAARETAIGNEIWQIEQLCGTNDVGTLSQRMYNCIHRIPIQLGNLALVKHEGFKSEQEWRITIPEHFPSTSASQLSALTD